MSRSISSVKYAALGVAGAIALAGCSAGQITQTSTQVSAVGGGSANIGQIAVRDTSFVFDESETAAIHNAGGDAALQGSIVNFGPADDKLVSVSSPVAGSVQLGGEAAIPSGRSLIIDGETAAAPSATAAPGGSATPGLTPQPTPTDAPTQNPTAAPTPGPRGPAGQPENAQTGTSTGSIMFSGLKQDLRSGLTYPVVFRFQNAGEVTVQVPVANPDTPRKETAGE